MKETTLSCDPIATKLLFSAIATSLALGAVPLAAQPVGRLSPELRRLLRLCVGARLRE